MSPRRRIGLALLALAASAVAAALTARWWLPALILEDRPLAGQNLAVDPEPGESDRLLADARDDRRLSLSAAELARLGGATGPEVAVYELSLDDGLLGCRAAIAVDGRWLNVESRVGFAMAAGRVTRARFARLRIGRLDFGGALAGWEAGPWIARRLAALTATDPALAAHVGALDRVEIIGDRVEVTLAPGWESALTGAW